MGVTKTNKELSVSQIDCGGSFKIKLSLTAEPDITSNPTDMVLILDRSGSMAGTPLDNLKAGAKTFIEIMDEATDGVKDGQIGGGSHIGIVSFSSTAVQDTGLITSVADLDATVDALTAGGSTNHADAFTKAVELFDPASTNAKIMIMFTDGMTTAGDPPTPIAEAAKAQGILIYCIGLTGTGGLDEQTLIDWASSPSSTYVALTPDAEELEKLFENIARSIVKPGATEIVIKDMVASCFKILSADTPTKGTAKILDDTTVEWTIDELGVTASETAVLEFTVEHVGPCTGVVTVNTSVTYSDHEGQHVEFPSPEIDVDCEGEVDIEECPKPVDITIGGCSDTVEFDAGDLDLEGLGRILKLDVTLKNICPHKRVALAIIVTEVDEHGLEYKRGMKTLVIPAHTREGCHDVTVRCVKFVLPEELDVSGTEGSICNERKFKARLIAHYIDDDFSCCDVVI